MGFVSSPALVSYVNTLQTASPNNVVPVALLASVAGNYANIDVAVQPKGLGAVMADSPTGTAAGGNKRGANAVDWQSSRGSATEVASGVGATISGGQQNTASGQYSMVPGGFACTASGQYAYAGGISCVSSAVASFAHGSGNTASGQGAVAFGFNQTISGDYSMSLAGLNLTDHNVDGRVVFGVSGGAGWNQSSMFNLWAQTTNATPTALTTNGGGVALTNTPVVGNFSAASFTGILIARHSTSGDVSAWRVEGLFRRGIDAASTALVASTVTLIGQDAGAAAWVVALTADTATGGLRVTVTGEAGKTIRWTLNLQYAETV